MTAISEIFSSADRTRGETLLRKGHDRGLGEKSFSALVVAAGRHFIDAPYGAQTLEREGPETLVVNLRAFDCVTFVEAVIVLAGLIHCGVIDFAAYPKALEKIRYRRGRCDGYPSRLHYFTDWLYDNGRKGLVRDITLALGGVPYPKTVHALTDRRSACPGLAPAAAFRRMRILESLCSRRLRHFLPKGNWATAAPLIQDGDLIAITTDEPGIDVCHVGIAVCDQDAVRLLHASSAAGRVVMTEGSLADYLAAKPSRTGVIVGRPVAPEKPGR
ncbi:MAG: DUF1460 domain-containing protein [Deltaproteobacteria bacterium]|nr:DUF1460 domain-containing protein [Deltaproteobacteria bacterium]